MKYEHISILKGSLTKEEVEQEIRNYKSFFEKHNIKANVEENLGLKKLAYEIKKNKQGYYLRYEIELEDTKIPELEKYARENDNIIKFITVRMSNDDLGSES